MKKLVMAVLMVCLAVPAFADKPAKTVKRKAKVKAVKVETEEEKTFYATGLVLARNLSGFHLSPAELRVVMKGLADGTNGRKPLVDFATYSKKSEQKWLERRDLHGKKMEELAPAYLAHAAVEEGAQTTKSGAVFRSVQEGKGASPVETDTVKVHYKSSLVDGMEMDSTYKRGEPEESRVKDYIICLREGILLMKPGGRARLVCPPETALGKEAFGFVPANSTLVYDVELLEFDGKSSDSKAE